MRVLLCDPNHSTKLALCGALEMGGLAVISATGVDEARFKIIMESPDFVLIDWLEFDIVHLDIKKFATQAKSMRPDTKFIFMSHKSVYTAVATFEQMVTEYGADGYILKPFNVSHVLQMLKTWSPKLTN